MDGPVLSLRSGSGAELEFEVQVSGTNEPIKDLRLSFFDDKSALSFFGGYIEGIGKFQIPCDKTIEKYAAYKLELLIGDSYFSPLGGAVEFITPVTVGAKIKGAHEIKKNNVHVGVKLLGNERSAPSGRNVEVSWRNIEE